MVVRADGPRRAEHLQAEPETIADAHPEVSIFFADIVGFTPLAGSMSPEALVALLNRVFSRFDDMTGEVVAGVLGKRKFVYDLWGDAVNVAARMESHGVVGAVHVGASTRALLPPSMTVEARGAIEVKGKGAMETFLVRPP